MLELGRSFELPLPHKLLHRLCAIESVLDSRQLFTLLETTCSSLCTLKCRSRCALIQEWLCEWWHDSASDDLFDKEDKALLADKVLAAALGL